MSKQIEMGDPVILKDASELQKFFLFDGCKGSANSLQVIDDEEYLCFMPKGMSKMFWLTASRFELDEEAMDA